MKPKRQYLPTEARREQIAEAALRVIAEGGVGAFTSRAVAEQVGITDGTVFRHFASKEEIVAAAMDLLEAQMFPLPSPPDGGPLGALEAFFVHRARLVTRRGAVGRLVFSDQLAHLAGEAGRERVRSWRERNLAAVAELLEQLARSGGLRADLPPVALVPIVHGAILTFAMRGALDAAPEDEALEADIRAVWRTLRALLTIPSTEELPDA